jgi:hypothetical protein
VLTTLEVYSLADELLLAAPLAADGLVCDRVGCDAPGAFIVPGARLCVICADDFGVGTPALSVPTTSG